MRSSTKGYLFLVLVLALSALSGYFYSTTKYQYGLDVEGGIRLTYRVKDLKPEQREQLPVIMSNLVDIMTARVAATLGVVEGNVQRKGTEELIVELPGFTDAARARETISSTASIKVYHAKNVNTERITFRPYDSTGRSESSTSPIESFMKRVPGGEPIAVEPGTPEYAEMIKGWDLVLEGADLKRAFAEVDAGGTVRPNFEFAPEGAKKLEAFTRKFFNQRENIAFVLDGKVLNLAPIAEGAILSDRAFLQGQFDPNYVNTLVRLLNAGALPVELEETSSQVVDPTIGSAAKDQMVRAGLIAFGFTALFLILYYAFPGLVALIALVLYTLFTLTVMKVIGATFSLAAIAGFILSVGMAVDANILVFERTKEEMREGRTLLTAVELGFKRALPAILDSNACTILTSLVLVWLGTGPVKGFASTLILGVIISLFTAITVTRSLLVFFVGSGIANNPKWFALDRQLFGKAKKEDGPQQIRVMERSKTWFAISIITIIPGLIFIFMGGLKPNVEFQGGIEATYKLTGSVTSPQIAASLERAGFTGANAKITSTDKGERFVSVTVPPSPTVRADDPAAYDRIRQAAGAGVEAMPVPAITGVGPSVQQETVTNAIKAIVISSVLIVLYLTARFGFAIGSLKNGFKFGMSAIGALVHDVLVVVGVAAILGYFLGWEIGALFITSMLTVIGFSVHDTIVIFDRIRENLRRPIPGEDFAGLCNRSVGQSFARSIMTSLTVIATLMIIIFVGSSTVDLRFFCAVMLAGIISGTYSSIFNAAPILWLWDKAAIKVRGEEHGLVAEATAEMNRIRSMAMQTQVAQSAAPSGIGLSTPGPAAGGPGTAQRGYGQTKRRQSAIDRSKQELDD